MGDRGVCQNLLKENEKNDAMIYPPYPDGPSMISMTCKVGQIRKMSPQLPLGF